MKSSIILLLSFFCQFSIYSQEISFEVKTAKYKKGYLPIEIEIVNNTTKNISLIIPYSLSVFLDSNIYRHKGWYAVVKEKGTKGEIERKGYERIKPGAKTKGVKLKTELGNYKIDEHEWGNSTIINLIPRGRIKKKILIAFPKSLHKALKKKKEYVVYLSYDIEEYINQYPFDKEIKCTRNIKFEKEIIFKKRR